MERAVVLFGAPIYVRHEVVHNKYVVDRLRTIGAVFVDELNEVPDGATVIFSAHGVPRVVQQEAKRRMLNVFDATCPLVTKVHMEITRYAREAREVFLIGQGRYSRRHAGATDRERRGRGGQFSRHWCGGYGVADARAGQSVALGKRPHQHRVRRREQHRGQRLPADLVIRFVDADQRMRREVDPESLSNTKAIDVDPRVNRA